MWGASLLIQQLAKIASLSLSVLRIFVALWLFKKDFFMGNIQDDEMTSPICIYC